MSCSVDAMALSARDDIDELSAKLYPELVPEPGHELESELEPDGSDGVEVHATQRQVYASA